jgi:hypothetical protein
VIYYTDIVDLVNESVVISLLKEAIEAGPVEAELASSELVPVFAGASTLAEAGVAAAGAEGAGLLAGAGISTVLAL